MGSGVVRSLRHGHWVRRRPASGSAPPPPLRARKLLRGPRSTRARRHFHAHCAGRTWLRGASSAARAPRPARAAGPPAPARPGGSGRLGAGGGRGKVGGLGGALTKLKGIPLVAVTQQRAVKASCTPWAPARPRRAAGAAVAAGLGRGGGCVELAHAASPQRRRASSGRRRPRRGRAPAGPPRPPRCRASVKCTAVRQHAQACVRRAAHPAAPAGRFRPGRECTGRRGRAASGKETHRREQRSAVARAARARPVSEGAGEGGPAPADGKARGQPCVTCNLTRPLGPTP